MEDFELLFSEIVETFQDFCHSMQVKQTKTLTTPFVFFFRHVVLSVKFPENKPLDRKPPRDI